MAHVSLRVTDKEKNLMESYAKLHGVSLSDVIKEAFFERLEDEFDLKAIDKYEKAKGDMRFYSMDEVREELGLENETV